jgi:NAD-dependent dihydropyrimidine dehydrogenase PreA subunit
MVKFGQKKCQAPVSHICNPSYSGGRDQKDCEASSRQTVHKITHTHTHTHTKGLVLELKV